VSKKACLLFSIYFSLCFSCSNDDATPANQIIGTWEVTSYTVTNCTDPEDNGFSGGEIDDLIGCYTFNGFDVEVCYSMSLIISADGIITSTITSTYLDPTTGTEQTSSDSTTVTYTINGDQIIICDSDDECNNGSLTVNANTLEISNTSSTDGCLILITAMKH
jgi:hypothetical protein